jgi:flagellar biosynthesis/type III secretory pathway chaperone
MDDQGNAMVCHKNRNHVNDNEIVPAKAHITKKKQHLLIRLRTLKQRRACIYSNARLLRGTDTMKDRHGELARLVLLAL